MRTTTTENNSPLDKLAQNFHGDVWSIIEAQLPLLRRVITPRKRDSTLTFAELQQSMSIMLFHSAAKAQRLEYTQGYHAITSCFKHFMYLCSHVENISPQVSLDIINAIDDVLSQMLSVFDPITVSFDSTLKDTDNSTTRMCIKKLDDILSNLANKTNI